MVVAAIRAVERRARGNNISYMQAYRIKQIIMFETNGSQSASFALLPDLLARI